MDGLYSGWRAGIFTDSRDQLKSRAKLGECALASIPIWMIQVFGYGQKNLPPILSLSKRRSRALDRILVSNAFVPCLDTRNP
jgi:hypothetical protein